jgi:hypothetical protein
VHEDDVGNQLLETGVSLDLESRSVAGMGRTEQLAQVAIYLQGEALKIPKAVENLGGDHKDVFGQCFGQRIILPRSGFCGRASSAPSPERQV